MFSYRPIRNLLVRGPKDAASAMNLQKRTLTNLYNERPTWLDLAHKKLDAVVAAGRNKGNQFMLNKSCVALFVSKLPGRSAPDVCRHALAQQEYLDHSSRREHVRHGFRSHVRCRLADLNPDDPGHFLPEADTRGGEQQPVKLLHLRGAGGALGEGQLGRGQGPAQRDDQRILTHDHGNELGQVARSLPLENAGRFGDLLCHGYVRLVHRCPS